MPEEEVELEEELVHCVMVLLNKPHGLYTLEVSSEGIPVLAVSVVMFQRGALYCHVFWWRQR